MIELIQLPPNSFYLWLATFFTFITAAMHFFLGGKFAAKPLLKAKMHPVAKYTNYYCWHMVTIVLLTMSVAFAISATYPSAWELGLAALFLSISFTIWNIVLWLWKKQSPLELPQWILFLTISVAGLMGFV